MDLEVLKKLGETIELVAARSAANELIVRALFHTHPNLDAARTYAERMLGQTLAQPHYVLNPQHAKTLRETVTFLMTPGPREQPEQP